MNTKALITTFAILGSSSAAMAAPSFSVSAGVSANAQFDLGARGRRDGRYNDWVESRDHRTHDYPSYPVAVYQPPAPPVPPVVAPVQDDCTNTRLLSAGSMYTGPVYSGWSDGYRHATIALTDPTRIDRRDELINVGAQAGRFDAIHLQATRGSSYIHQVMVQFTNGAKQIVTLDRGLDARSPSLTVDLDGHDRQILRIVVYGETAPHSTYQILAT